MKLIKQVIVVVVFFALSFSAFADDSNKALDSFLAKLEALNSMQADFVQSTRDNHNNVLQEIKGTLLVAKPGKMRWQTQPPYSQLVVSDNQSVWLYDEDLEQVTIRDMEQRIQETPALLLSGDTQEISKNFEIQFKQDDDFSRYTLLPKDKSQLFERIEFQYYGDVLESMRIHDATGQTTEIVFSEIQQNPEVNDSMFTFKAPEGIDVIDARGGF